MAQDMPIGALLAEGGFNTIASSRTAREALVRYGLTNHRKKNIAVKKLSRVREVLTREFYRACDDLWCQAVGGLEAEGRVEIISGLQPGEKVVIAGNDKLQNGVSVRLAGDQPPGGRKADGKAGSSSRQSGKGGDGQ